MRPDQVVLISIRYESMQPIETHHLASDPTMGFDRQSFVCDCGYSTYDFIARGGV